MAVIQGWAAHSHLAKKREAKIVSHGHTMGFLGGRPETLHFTFRQDNGQHLVVELKPQEVEEVRVACTEFGLRRGA